ncbi:tRNA-dihydrouridine synthase, partial [Limnoraphis robusta CCNP1324]|uniref:tRNA-dihydrouridine synthase n=1 Tax=Limnoraphis robusta TaxID=1118279 RepID=UPI002B1FA243
MSLCRLVFDGGGPSVNYLPARKGQLFNPAEYPWLETPWTSDGVVLAVLRNLLIVNGERIGYRALDVEQIGSVYEGIMGYAVRRIPGRCIGLKSKPQGAKKQITTAVDLDALLALPGGKRKAWLEGLSPKENRDIPPLDYGRVHRLKLRLPERFIGINGGIATLDEAAGQLRHVDGVMMGRAAYHMPALLGRADRVLFGDDRAEPDLASVIDHMAAHAEAHIACGGRLTHVTRHMVGLFHGLPGARRFRQI